MEERKKDGDSCIMMSLLGYIVVCVGIWLVSRFLKEVHQENMRVVFRVFVSGNDISESYVFVTDVFQHLCLWMQIFHIWSKAFISLSPKVSISQLEVFSCEGHVIMNFEIV